MKPRKGYVYKRGNVYWINYIVDGTRFQESLETTNERTAKTKAAEKMQPYASNAEAERLAAIGARLKAAKSVAASAGHPATVGKGWELFTGLDKDDRPEAGPVTMRMYETLWNTFAEWMEKTSPAVKTLRSVQECHAKAFIRHLDGLGLSVGRVNKYKRFLKMFFRVVSSKAGILENPFHAIETRDDSQTAKQPFTVEELQAIVTQAKGELQTLFLLGFGTGLRLGDCCTLLWGETDLVRRRILRVPNKTARTSGAAVKIGLPHTLAEHLATLPRSGPFVLPGLAKEYETGHAPEISKRIQAHLTSCGIQTVKPGTGEGSEKRDKDGEPIPGTAKRAVVLKGFHSFRHSFVSLNADAGTPQATMQKLVGHGSPMMTLHYLTPSDKMVLAAADALPALLPDNTAKPAPQREPLPAWAVADLRKMTVKNWEAVRDSLLKMSS